MMTEDFKQPLFTIDNVLFSVENGDLKVLLVKRALAPFDGNWSLPGGFIDVVIDQNVQAAAMRKLQQKTGLVPGYLEQLEVFSGKDRDPRGYSVSLAFFALVPYTTVSSNIATVSQASWWSISAIEQLTLAYDHHQIIVRAHQRLKQKALYSMLPVFCLPEVFTVGQLKQVIEAIIGKAIQRKSLMRRIEASNMFTLTEQKIASGGRQAQVYQLKPGVDITHFDRNFAS
tara:strand:- start:856 stop:1542 length:687 start_codon:yes stop_codon:yes gene_type:complete